jgi:hypothetical protein
VTTRRRERRERVIRNRRRRARLRAIRWYQAQDRAAGYRYNRVGAVLKATYSAPVRVGRRIVGYGPAPILYDVAFQSHPFAHLVLSSRYGDDAR